MQVQVLLPAGKPGCHAMEKNELFTSVKPGKALAIMAIPTIISQVVILVYNLADIWFIGRTNDPYMIAASTLAATIFLAIVALANVFGVGGGSLMVRLLGEKRTEEARRVASYSVAMACISALVFSLLTLVFMEPMLRLLGASENTLLYGKQYALTTTVLGGVPTVLSMSMSQLLRNAGYAKESGFGVSFGSLLNVALDPIFMFCLLPQGYEVLGSGIATMVSNVCSLLYFIVKFRKLRDKTVLVIPVKLEKIGRENLRSLYSVGLPAACSVVLYDLVTIVTNRLTAQYGDISLAAMGIVLKLERIPVNVGLGVCLGMVPLVAYNYGAKNTERMKRISGIACAAIVTFSVVCVLLFRLFPKAIVSGFISNEETIAQGISFLQGRCLALPFVMVGYHVMNFMNAVNQGKISFVLAILRHIVLLIPIMVFMNEILGLTGLIWSQPIADLLNAGIAVMFYCAVIKEKRWGIAFWKKR